MSIYICECCEKQKDNDYDNCYDAPVQLTGYNSGLICEGCAEDIAPEVFND